MPGTAEEGQCIACSSLDCKTCDSQTGFCLECKSGLYLHDGYCLPCPSLCSECTSPDNCTFCSSIAKPDSENPQRCVCDYNNNWLVDETGALPCSCSTGIVSPTMGCVACYQLIPDCFQCSSSDGTHVGDLNLGLPPASNPN